MSLIERADFMGSPSGSRKDIATPSSSPPPKTYAPQNKRPLEDAATYSTAARARRTVAWPAMARRARETTKPRPKKVGASLVEAAGFEPASASAPSARFYERSSRFSFAYLSRPGRR